MSEPSEVAVVICTHTEDRWEDIVAAVASVRGQSAPPAETVLVSDHNQRLLERLRHEFADLVVVPNPGERGESGARNAGVAASCAPIVAFLDDDAVADARWLERLTAWYEDPEVLGVGGGADPRWDTSRPAWFPTEFDWVVGCSYRGLPEQAAPVRNLMGCNMSFRRSAINAVDGFYSGLGRVGGTALGCSETEFCLRAGTRLGGRFVFEPRARISHRVPAGRTELRYFIRRCRDEGRSKAHLARRSGRDRALETERAYVRTVLPRGVVAGLRDAARADLAGLGRASAIVAGVAVTGSAYAAGVLSGAEATS